MQWRIDSNQWQQLLDQSAEQAIKAVDGTKEDNLQAWQHAEQLGIVDESRERSIRYAQ